MKPVLSLPHVVSLLKSNKMQQAKFALDEILTIEPQNALAMELMVKYSFLVKDYKLAEKYLLLLLDKYPSTDNYINPLVELYSYQKRWRDIADYYQKLSDIEPINSVVLYNCAYYSKLAGEFTVAIELYNKALRLGISNDYEVSLNIATIYSDHLSSPPKAIDILNTAIKKHPEQDSLLYNLANIYEQLGDKNKALLLFQSAYKINPNNYSALARQADIHKFITINDNLIKQMELAFQSNKINMSDKINIAYALGKAFDDCENYQIAFQYYEKANILDQTTLPSYDPSKIENYIDDIIKIFNKDWYESFVKSNDDLSHNTPIFICGMFRSGSTLCEQILAAHSQVNNGGEQEFFHRLIVNDYTQYPLKVVETLATKKNIILRKYFIEIGEFIKNNSLVTDKRPDNFLYLGLIKALMPKAKIIWTTRNKLDNCLSVYFLRLGASMSYSTEIENIIHFYQQQEKLMMHWQTIFGEDIFRFDYDQLIVSPQKCTNDLLSFVDLPWEDNCLEFYQIENQIKTASVWQVRQPLYKRSSGRWKNYREFLTFKNTDNLII